MCPIIIPYVSVGVRVCRLDCGCVDRCVGVMIGLWVCLYVCRTVHYVCLCGRVHARVRVGVKVEVWVL